MSVRNGMLTRRAGLVLGSACFLATALSASNVHASATLALVPTGTLPSGASYDATSHTLTLPAGSPVTFNYDVVVSVTGTTPSVSRIQGAVVTSSTGTVVGNQNAYTVGSQYNETTGTFVGTNAAVGHTDAVFSLTSASTAGQAFGTKYTFKPGFTASSASNVSGVGPQSGTFSSLVNTAGSSSNSRAQVTYATPVAGASLDALTASVTLNGAAGSTATLAWADGTGSTASTPGAGTVYQSALEWAENGSSFFSGVSGSYSQFGLNIQFANTTPTFLQGDLNFDGNLDDSDTAAFILATVDEASYISTYVPAQYQATFSDADFLYIADFNYDGNVDDSDTAAFIQATVDGSFPPPPGGVAFTASVPEPTSALGAAAFGAVGLLARRRR